VQNVALESVRVCVCVCGRLLGVGAKLQQQKTMDQSFSVCDLLDASS
jgi:hypothetical protein